MRSVNYPVWHDIEDGEYTISVLDCDESVPAKVIAAGEVYTGSDSGRLDISEFARHVITSDKITAPTFEQSDNVVEFPLAGTVNRMVKADGYYVAACNNGVIAYSTDGIIWTANTVVDDSIVLHDIVVATQEEETVLVAVGSGSTIIFSIYGTDEWIPLPVEGLPEGDYYAIEYGNSLFQISINNEQGNHVYYISDNSNRWIAGINNLGGIIYDILWDGSQFVFTSQHVSYWSSSGTAGTWSGRPFTEVEGSESRQIGWNGTNHVFPFQEKVIAAPNISSYQVFDKPEPAATYGVAYNGGTWILAEGNEVLYTDNFKNYITRGIDGYATSVLVDNGLIIFGARDGIFTITGHSYSTLQQADMALRFKVSNSDEVYTMVYDYNTQWISEIGDFRANNDPIRAELVAGQFVVPSIYNATCGATTQISVYLNSVLIDSSSPVGPSSYYWYDTLGANASAGDEIRFDIASSGMSESQTYTFIKPCHRYVIYYLNKFGGIDSLVVKGTTTESYNNSDYTIDGNYDRSLPQNFQYRRIQNTTTKILTMNIGRMTNSQAAKIDHLYLSPKVWVHDLKEGLIYAVNVNDSSFGINSMPVNNTNGNNYTINLALTQDIIRKR